MDLKRLKRTIVHRGRVFTTIVDDVEYPSGRKSIREIAQHPGGAVAIAMFPDKRTILIKQHRYPLDRFIWELPAGKLEPNEEPLACAQRELGEETGYRANTWRRLTTVYPSPGFCDELLHLYLATDLEVIPEGRKLEEGELTMTVEIFPFETVLSMIEREEIPDAKTICAVFFAERLLRRGEL
ncbi:MAG TPA: NUDIX hydrolase [Bacteroidota bacterium]|nr:NUDIX hydrolase [Bacteroidota bacterium]